MKYKALIVDDAPDIVSIVEDIVDSLNHEHDSVDCLEKARELLAATDYHYFLLDLELPVRKGRSIPRVQNGVNLVTEVRLQTEAPIIVMTSHGKDSPYLAVEVMKRGAIDFITKPFPESGEGTLDRKIQEALARFYGSSDSPRKPRGQAKPKERQQFHGGELVFFPERVELNGVKICGAERHGRIRKILEALRAKTSLGKFMALSGAELSKMVLKRPDQNAISDMIHEFREKVIELMLEFANVEVEKNDLITTTKGGYAFAEWITVRDAEDGELVNRDGALVNELVNRKGELVNALVNRGSALVNEVSPAVRDRRERLVSALKKGERMRVPALAAAVKSSPGTVKRDLEALKDEGRVVFEGAPKTGSWRLSG